MTYRRGQNQLKTLGLMKGRQGTPPQQPRHQRQKSSDDQGAHLEGMEKKNWRERRSIGQWQQQMGRANGKESGGMLHALGCDAVEEEW